MESTLIRPNDVLKPDVNLNVLGTDSIGHSVESTILWPMMYLIYIFYIINMTYVMKSVNLELNTVLPVI